MWAGADALKLFQQFSTARETVKTVLDNSAHSNTPLKQGVNEKIERTLRLRQHSEPGLCRSAFVDTFTPVQLSSGMLVSLETAKRMGLLPPNAPP